MKKRKGRIVAIAILLMACIGNYMRMPGAREIRTVEFLSILAIGMMFALLVRESIAAFKSPDKPGDRQ
ncbi:MAG: hypothetical protein EOO51_05490 [Flavobacterium sp.]|nr:MAG: hypothetical protein EOO51_05490 [Flavobacterium sp.]